MNRWSFTKGSGDSPVSLGLPPAARLAASCKIIGIGQAGCNFVLYAAKAGTVLNCAEWTPEFICIRLDWGVPIHGDVLDPPIPGYAPITTLSLATSGTAGRVNRGRAAALRKRGALKRLLAGTDVVFLVAGLGGGTGSGVTPIMARLAREAGALTVAAVLTPFEFEGEQRNRNADTAMEHLNREADLVVRFSNQGLQKDVGDDIFIDDFFAVQNKRIAVCLRSLMDGDPDPGNHTLRQQESGLTFDARAREHVTKNGRFTEAQIALTLKQMALVTEIDEVCRKIGISDATFCKWRQKYGGLLPADLRRLRQLEEENSKLKRLVADLSLDKAMLQDVLSKRR